MQFIVFPLSTCPHASLLCPPFAFVIINIIFYLLLFRVFSLPVFSSFWLPPLRCLYFKFSFRLTSSVFFFSIFSFLFFPLSFTRNSFSHSVSSSFQPLLHSFFSPSQLFRWFSLKASCKAINRQWKKVKLLRFKNEETENAKESFGHEVRRKTPKREAENKMIVTG